MATIEVTSDNFDATVEGSEVVVIDYWADWCGPCRAFAPIFEAASQGFPGVVFGKCNVEEQPGLADRFDIRGIPTLQVFRQQVLVFAEPGMLPETALKELLGRVQGLDMDAVRAEIAARPTAEETQD